MKVIVGTDKTEMGRQAAEQAARVLTAAIAARGEARVIFASAASRSCRRLRCAAMPTARSTSIRPRPR